MRVAMHRYLPAMVCGLLGFASTAGTVVAQTAPADDGWRVSIVPYLWLPSVDTTFNIDGMPDDGESDSDGVDIFQELEFALMGTMEVRKDRFAIIGDFQYVKLGSDFSASVADGVVLDTDYDLSIGSGLGLLSYRFVDEPNLTLDGAVGARLLWTEISAELDVSGGPSFDGDGSITVVDPVIGARGRYSFSERWSISGMGNIGGFGVGTELTWEALGTIDYRFNEHLELRVGYRAFSIDLDEDNVKLDVLLHGPVVGLVITF